MKGRVVSFLRRGRPGPRHLVKGRRTLCGLPVEGRQPVFAPPGAAVTCRTCARVEAERGHGLGRCMCGRPAVRVLRVQQGGILPRDHLREVELPLCERCWALEMEMEMARV
ncbi:MAG: hypothetical protein KatS3mg049_2115 [Caldilinea sp.]|nr:MAG: hypothetical protein KatS3mg049_2115 [Caldilinea sp.]